MKSISFFTCLLIVLFISIIIPGCKSGDTYSLDDAIIEDPASQFKFKQIVFTMSLVANESQYVLLEKIDSISVKVNGKYWGKYSSEIIDTVDVDYELSNNFKLTLKKVSYLVVAEYKLDASNLETAGDIAEYLNNRLVLSPGDYVCEIKDVMFKNELSEWITIKPFLYSDFTVVENTTASFAGDFTININQ